MSQKPSPLAGVAAALAIVLTGVTGAYAYHMDREAHEAHPMTTATVTSAETPTLSEPESSALVTRRARQLAATADWTTSDLQWGGSDAVDWNTGTIRVTNDADVVRSGSVQVTILLEGKTMGTMSGIVNSVSPEETVTANLLGSGALTPDNGYVIESRVVGF
jgi:hypothetical protein